MIQKALVVDYDSGSHTATIRYLTSLGGTVAGVPVSTAIQTTEIADGDTVAVAIFESSVPGDALIVGVY